VDGGGFRCGLKAAKDGRGGGEEGRIAILWRRCINPQRIHASWLEEKEKKEARS